jgi:hypothetical protein
MQVGGRAELRSWVLSFGAGAQVLEPARLRDEVRAEMAAGLARYDRDDTVSAGTTREEHSPDESTAAQSSRGRSRRSRAARSGVSREA